MTVLWDTDPESGDRYAVALGEHLRVAESSSAVQRLLDEDPGELLVVAGPGVSLDAACQLASALRLTRPALGVVLTRSRVDVGALQQAVTAGVRAVVDAGDLPGVADACRRSRELSDQLAGLASGAAPSVMGRVVTVFSAKGGVGKTTFSTNIGVHLATLGYRTLILDLDLGFGDVGISLQLVPRQTLEDVVGMVGSLDEPALAQLVTTHPTGSTSSPPPSRRAGPTASRRGGHRGPARGPALLRLRHRRHPAGVHRPRPGLLRRQRRGRPHRDPRHPGHQEPAPHPRHPRPARHAARAAHRRAQPLRLEGRPAHLGRRRDDQAGHRRHGPGQRRRARLGQQGRADPPRRPAPPGERRPAHADRALRPRAVRHRGPPRPRRARHRARRGRARPRPPAAQLGSRG